MIGHLTRCATAIVALAGPLAAETLRVATWEPGLSRDRAGLLLHELRGEPTEAVATALAVIRAARPDVLLLTRFDHDLRGAALAEFAALLAEGTEGIDYPHRFHAPVNAGVPSGHDLDGDGTASGRDDAFGWGAYPGHGGMAILSRLPLDEVGTRSFRTLRWVGLPGAKLPVRADGGPFPDAAAQEVMRLSSRAHWDVPVILPGDGRLHLLAANPTPPLFDGEEGRNLRRNHDEIAFWSAYLDGHPFRDDAGGEAGAAAAPFVILGNLNLDPHDGAGMRGAIAGLLGHVRVTDPRPASAGAAASADPGHAGPPELDTADWGGDQGPGNLRVDYVLPSAGLVVADAGVVWPAPGEPLAEIVASGPPHRLVWVDLDLP